MPTRVKNDRSKSTVSVSIEDVVGVEDDVDVDMGNEPANAPPPQTLEDKYASQMRQIFPIKVELPWATLLEQINKQMNLHPEFQRRLRWTDEQRSRFIESVIMNVPVPPLFLGESKEYGKYQVLDGRQRLTAARDFLSNKLRLSGLKVWPELNGKTWDDFKPLGFEPTVTRRFLPAVILSSESSPEVKLDIFDRLNSGGTKAEPMEVRNAVYAGPFNDLIHELSAEDGFRQLWGIPIGPDDEMHEKREKNGTYAKMDDLELVLRFFALAKKGPGVLQKRVFKDHLSIFMGEQNTRFAGKPNEIEEARETFRRAISNTLLVFGEGAFKSGPSNKRSAPYADAVMHALAHCDPSQLDERMIERVRGAFVGLRKDPDFKAVVSAGTNGGSAIEKRIRLARDAVGAALSNSASPKGKSRRKAR